MNNSRYVDISKAEKWPDETKRMGIGGPKHIDMPCPHEGCGKPTFGIPLSWKIHTKSAVAEIECASCDRRIAYLLVNAPEGEPNEESRTSIYQVAC